VTWHTRIPVDVTRGRTPSEVACLVVLYRYATRDGRVSIGHTQLAREAGLCRRTVITVMTRLLDLGVIHRETVGKGTTASLWIVPLVVQQMHHSRRVVVQTPRRVVVQPLHPSQLYSHVPCDDGNGTCSTCQLPVIHRAHRGAG
jgi:hypothetical protein